MLNIETAIVSPFFAYPFFQVQKFPPLIWLFFLFLWRITFIVWKIF